MAGIENALKVELFKKVLWIRCCEEALAEVYSEQEMRTPTHFGIGQEAVAAGVCGVLQADDVVYTHHRSHNHYLARGGDFYALAGELYGREDGCSHGRGGSVHLTSRDGDAACEEGILYESLNYASVKNLPVILVCENNLYSTESALAVRQPQGTKLCDRVRSFKVPAETVDGNDVFAVFDAARQARARIRAGGGPQFLECMTYRWREHVGPQFDHRANRNYRDEAELLAWMDNCPVVRGGEVLVKDGLASEADLKDWETEYRETAMAQIRKAQQAPWPEPKDLFANVY
jgi:pyruvate dehydrogenase E1 component alpha subunit